MYDERSFFFEGAAGPLYGVLFSPRGEGRSRTPAVPGRGVVICDSLFEEKFFSERANVNLARRLAESGLAVLMFDYRGYGNSVGESEEVDPAGLLRSAQDACDFLRGAGCGRLVLVGVRWGAAVAEQAARSRDDVEALFLVQPLASWRKALLQALRANVAGQYSVFKKVVMTRDEIIKELTGGGDCVRAGYRMNNVDGYIISRAFYEQSEGMKLPGAVPPRAPAVVFEIREGDACEDRESAELVAAWRGMGASCEHVVVAGDNRFWFNNRIFTSVVPNLYREIEDRLKALPAAPAAAGAPRDGLMRESIVHGGVRETALDFASSSGKPLFGVLYEPEKGGTAELGFVFTHGGLIGMNGAFRFNTRAARRLAGEGIRSLCFDPHGMGRSIDGIGNIDQRQLFRKIQSGLFADDVERAVAFFRSRTGDRRVTLFGVCGGAITSCLAYGRSRGIDTAVLLSIPIMLSGLSHEEIRMSDGYALFYLGLYARKIFNPKAWWRLITFQSEYGMIGKSLSVGLGGVVRRLRRRAAPARSTSAPACTPPPPAAETGAAGQALPEGSPAAEAAERKSLSATSSITMSGIQFNEHFLAAYRSIVARRGKVLFVFGDNDNFKWEFYGEFAEKYPADMRAGEGIVTIETVKHANHMYTLREWQDEIITLCLRWFRENGFLERS
jgi:pimeloyl-ACP methyl ester carboxylesterase